MDIDEKAPGNISQQDVTVSTDNETGHDSKSNETKIPHPEDDKASVDEDMSDVDANNSVSGEHPDP